MNDLYLHRDHIVINSIHGMSVLHNPFLVESISLFLRKHAPHLDMSVCSVSHRPTSVTGMYVTWVRHYMSELMKILFLCTYRPHITAMMFAFLHILSLLSWIESISCFYTHIRYTICQCCTLFYTHVFHTTNISVCFFSTRKLHTSDK